MALLGFTLAVGQQTARAQVVIYDQALNLNDDGGPYSYLGQQIADRFSVTQDFTLSGAVWFGDDFTAVTPTFEIRLYYDVGSFPDTIPFYQTTVIPTVVNTGLSTGGTNIFQFTATLDTPVGLIGGDPYWISIQENPFTNFRWANGTSLYGSDLDNSLRNSDIDTWRVLSGNRNQSAFSLLAIPEPGTWVLLALGATALGLKFRRRS